MSVNSTTENQDRNLTSFGAVAASGGSKKVTLAPSGVTEVHLAIERSTCESSRRTNTITNYKIVVSGGRR